MTRLWGQKRSARAYASKLKQQQSARSRRRTAGTSDLRRGEALIMSYSTDCTPCGCVTHMKSDIACTSVATTMPPQSKRGTDGFVDRCLNCGTTWTARRYRWEPTTVLSTSEAA